MQRKILNVSAIVFSSVLCVFLVLLLVITPFYYSVTSLTKPETIVKIVQDVDYKKLAEESKAAEDAFKSFGLTGESADKLIKSEKVGKLVEVYADETVELLMAIPNDREWDAALVKEVVNDNMDRIVEVADENTEQSISKKQLKTKITSALDKNEHLIEDVAPILQQVKVVVEMVKASELIQRTMTIQFAIALTVVFILTVTAICVLRRKKFKGFLWIAICFIVAAVLLAVIVVYSKSGFVNFLAVQMSDFGTEIMTSAISVCVDKLITALLCSVALVVIFLAVFVLGYRKTATCI